MDCRPHRQQSSHRPHGAGQDDEHRTHDGHQGVVAGKGVSSLWLKSVTRSITRPTTPAACVILPGPLRRASTPRAMRAPAPNSQNRVTTE